MEPSSKSKLLVQYATLHGQHKFHMATHPIPFLGQMSRPHSAPAVTSRPPSQPVLNTRPQTRDPQLQSNAPPNATNAANIRCDRPCAADHTPIVLIYATSNLTVAGHALQRNISQSAPPTIKSEPIQFTTMSTLPHTCRRRKQKPITVIHATPAVY